MMRDTINVLTVEEGNKEAIIEAIHHVIKKVQEYVLGYHLKGEPVFDGKRVSVTVEVEGAGDFFPPVPWQITYNDGCSCKGS